MSYEDIISLPHHVSQKHPPMSLEERAAQFSPFAALVGYDACVEESNRLVEQFLRLDENYLQELDEKLRHIQEHICEQPLVEITYFVPDLIKSGGSYSNMRGGCKKNR